MFSGIKGCFVPEPFVSIDGVQDGADGVHRVSEKIEKLATIRMVRSMERGSDPSVTRARWSSGIYDTILISETG